MIWLPYLRKLENCFAFENFTSREIGSLFFLQSSVSFVWLAVAFSCISQLYLWYLIIIHPHQGVNSLPSLTLSAFRFSCIWSYATIYWGRTIPRSFAFINVHTCTSPQIYIQTFIYIYVYIGWSKKMPQFLIRHKFQSGVHSHVKLHTRQFNMFRVCILNLNLFWPKIWKCQMFQKRVSENSISCFD